MSASKGLGATAKAVSDMMPPELLRFLMVRTRPNQPIDFNIDGDTIPRLYDNHDECAEIYFGKATDNPDLGRAFYYAQLDPATIQRRFLPRFSRIAFIVQIPHLDLETEVQKLKEAPLTTEDRREAADRADYARIWLRDFASESARFEIQSEIPEGAYDLSLEQKEFLESVAILLRDSADLTGEALHARLHELRKASPLQARDAFGAIYLALLGKDSGPQAGWFLEAVDRRFLIERFLGVVALPAREKPVIESLITSLVVIDKEVRERFQGIKIGFRVMKGVRVAPSDPQEINTLQGCVP
jgi:lysyl-tRNA synthetase class 1